MQKRPHSARTAAARAVIAADLMKQAGRQQPGKAWLTRRSPYSGKEERCCGKDSAEQEKTVLDRKFLELFFPPYLFRFLFWMFLSEFFHSLFMQFAIYWLLFTPRPLHSAAKVVRTCKFSLEGIQSFAKGEFSMDWMPLLFTAQPFFGWGVKSNNCKFYQIISHGLLL